MKFLLSCFLVLPFLYSCTARAVLVSGALLQLALPWYDSLEPYQGFNVPTEAELIGLVDALKGDRRISYSFSEEGCRQRAILMCELLERNKVPCRGIIAEAEQGFDFEVRGWFLPGGKINWTNHWAVILPVLEGTSRLVFSALVIDPVLLEKAAPISHWLDRIRGHQGEGGGEGKAGLRFHIHDFFATKDAEAKQSSIEQAQHHIRSNCMKESTRRERIFNRLNTCLGYFCIDRSQIERTFSNLLKLDHWTFRGKIGSTESKLELVFESTRLYGQLEHELTAELFAPIHDARDPAGAFIERILQVTETAAGPRLVVAVAIAEGIITNQEIRVRVRELALEKSAREKDIAVQEALGELALTLR